MKPAKITLKEFLGHSLIFIVFEGATENKSFSKESVMGFTADLRLSNKKCS